MPAFTPRTKDEIFQSLVMRMVALSRLSDLNENSEMTTALGIIAEELEAVGYRVEEFHAAHHFENVSGSLARDRIAQMPNGGLGGQLPETPAYGAVLVCTRSSDVGEETIAVGDVLVGRSDRPGVLYMNAEEIVFDDGVGTTDAETPLRLLCLTSGEIGNCPAGAIDTVVKGPSSLVSVTSVDALTNGKPAETTAEYVARAQAYLASLAARPPKAGLQYLASTFRSSSGIRTRHGRVFRDPWRPGYVELMVDDGYAFQGFTRAGKVCGGTIPLNGQSELWFESPAATTPEIWVNGVKLEAQYGVEPDWRVELELGRVQFKDESILLAPGDTWEVKNYSVFTDLIAELQAKILGATSDLNEPGWVAAGNRCRVVVPRNQDVELDLVVWLASGYRLEDVEDEMDAACIAHMGNLGSGDPFRPFRLCAELNKLSFLEDLIIRSPSEPVWPAQGYRLVTRPALVKVTTGE